MVVGNQHTNFGLKMNGGDEMSTYSVKTVLIALIMLFIMLNIPLIFYCLLMAYIWLINKDIDNDDKKIITIAYSVIVIIIYLY